MTKRRKELQRKRILFIKRYLSLIGSSTKSRVGMNFISNCRLSSTSGLLVTSYQKASSNWSCTTTSFFNKIGNSAASWLPNLKQPRVLFCLVSPLMFAHVCQFHAEAFEQPFFQATDGHNRMVYLLVHEVVGGRFCFEFQKYRNRSSLSGVVRDHLRNSSRYF